MKQIDDFIQEKLKIDKDIEVNDIDDKLRILDENINYVKDLRNIVEKYFKTFHINVTPIKSTQIKWKIPNTKDNILVGDHFEVQFMDGSFPYHVRKKLKFASFGNKFLVQLDIKSYTGKFEPGKIHGRFNRNEFNRGDSFLDFMLKIKELTDKKDVFERDPDLVNLFHLNKNND